MMASKKFSKFTVKLIAGFGILTSLLNLILGILILLKISFPGAELIFQGTEVGIILLIFSVALFWIYLGLWRLKNYARITVIILSMFALISTAAFIKEMLYEGIVQIIINLIILYFLFVNKGVINLFKRKK